jgi:hypothetical protein
MEGSRGGGGLQAQSLRDFALDPAGSASPNPRLSSKQVALQGARGALKRGDTGPRSSQNPVPVNC